MVASLLACFGFNRGSCRRQKSVSSKKASKKQREREREREREGGGRGRERLAEE